MPPMRLVVALVGHGRVSDEAAGCLAASFLSGPENGFDAVSPAALVLAAMEPEPTDDDRTLFLVQDSPDSGWRLVEEAGFHTSPVGLTGGEIGIASAPIRRRGPPNKSSSF